MVGSENQRVSRELRVLAAEIQLEYIKRGKRAPTFKELTAIIASKLKKEDILYDKFIRF